MGRRDRIGSRLVLPGRAQVSQADLGTQDTPGVAGIDALHATAIAEPRPIDRHRPARLD